MIDGSALLMQAIWAWRGTGDRPGTHDGRNVPLPHLAAGIITDRLPIAHSSAGFERAVDLARMLRALLPGHRDVTGLLALILLTDARRDARVDPDSGRLVLLAEQDRRRWDPTAISEGVALVREALRHRPPGRFALMAAIAAVHDEAPTFDETDWREVLGLYDLLIQLWPSPVVALNRSVALGHADGPAAGLAALEELATEPQLAGYGYLVGARGDFLRRLGRSTDARTAYERALLLTENTVEQQFLASRLAGLKRRP